jgi:hypothetical protein
MIKFLPQVLLIAIYGYGLYEAKKNNGKNINVSFWNEVVAVLFFLALLFWGGFFNIFIGG